MKAEAGENHLQEKVEMKRKMGSNSKEKQKRSTEALKKWKCEPLAKITGVTTGKVIDYGVRDSMNMGAAMAPAACDLISQHFKDFRTTPEDYDRIITGDLGTVGKQILIETTIPDISRGKERGPVIKGGCREGLCFVYV